MLQSFTRRKHRNRKIFSLDDDQGTTYFDATESKVLFFVKEWDYVKIEFAKRWRYAIIRNQ